jgi:hypothetical protein
MPKCSKYHAKGQILVPHCCKYKANGTRKESQNKFQNLSKKKSKNYSEPFLSQTSMFFFNFWLEVKQPIINKKPPAAARKKVRREAWLKLAIFPKTSSTF